MTQSQARLQYIVPHPTDLKIAIISENDTWTLPTIIPDLESGRFYNHYQTGMATQTLWNWHVVTLYQAQAIFHDAFNDNRWIYVIENLDQRHDLPENIKWIAHDALHTIQWDNDDLIPIIERYFDEIINDNVPKARVAWAKIGWQTQAFEWIHSQLTNLGHKTTGDIEILRRWCITATYRVPTYAGYFYFKAVPETFAREIPITEWLATQFPEHLPKIVAYDIEKRFLLMADFEAEALMDSKNISNWESSLKTYAKLQLGTVNQTKELLKLGAMNYRLDDLLSRYATLLADDEFVTVNHMLNQNDIEAIRTTLPTIEQHLSLLKALNLPDTILHCDFQAFNVAVDNDRVIIFDWTDASIGNPLIDLAAIEGTAREAFPESPENHTQLRDAYLLEFTQYASISTLQEAYKSAQIIGNVLQAVNYHHLLQSIEPNQRWILNLVPQYLKRLLEQLQDI